MPAARVTALSKGEVMMYLAIAELRRADAAREAKVSESTFRRAMRRYRIKAPRSDAKLNEQKVREALALLKKHSRAAVAERLGVHRRTIDQIADRVTWLRVVV